MSEDMANSPAGQTPDINSGPQEIRLLIHQSIVGGIIGKAKRIRDENCTLANKIMSRESEHSGS